MYENLKICFCIFSMILGRDRQNITNWSLTYFIELPDIYHRVPEKVKWPLPMELPAWMITDLLLNVSWIFFITLHCVTLYDFAYQLFRFSSKKYKEGPSDHRGIKGSGGYSGSGYTEKPKYGYNDEETGLNKLCVPGPAKRGCCGGCGICLCLAALVLIALAAIILDIIYSTKTKWWLKGLPLCWLTYSTRIIPVTSSHWCNDSKENRQ